MSSLTETSVITRKAVIWIVIIVGILIAVRVMVLLGIGYWHATHPIPIPPPNTLFGKLPAPDFVNMATSSANLKYTLVNIEGHPPETTDAAKVYPMPKRSTSITSAQNAQQFAKRLNFSPQPEMLTPTYYKFTDPEDKLHTLEVDIVTLNFKILYNYQKNPQIFFQGTINSKDQALGEIKSYAGGLFNGDLTKGKLTLDLLKFDNTTRDFIPASSLSNTDAVRVNFFRSDLDGLKVLPPDFNKSYSYIIYTPSNNQNWKFPDVEYTFWPLDYNFATYPLRSSQEAWQALQEGKGYVANMGKNNPGDTVVIRNIYLAYYDSKDPQPYLQPVFVFEGDNNFAVYIAAVAPNWLE